MRRTMLVSAWSRLASLPETQWRLLVFAGALLLGITRRPEVIFRPAPILEGGAVFYVGTYFGEPLEILLRPYAGYQHLLVRLGSFFERLTDPVHAPLLGSLLSLIVLAAFAVFLASDRFSGVVPSRVWRVVLAGGVVLLPHALQTHGYLVDLPRYLPLYLLALSLVAAPKRKVVRALELGWLVIVGLSGPYAVVLQPLFWVRAWRTRDHYWMAASAVLALTTFAQLATIAIDGRRPGNFDEPIALAIVATWRLTTGALAGTQLPIAAMELIGIKSATPALLAVYAAIAAAALPILWRLWKLLPRTVAWSGLFVWLAIGAASFAGQREGFDVLAWPLYGARYTVVPGALMGLLVVSGLIRAQGRLRFGAAILGVLMAGGWIGDARLQPFPDYDWAERSNACIGSAAPCELGVWNPYTWTIHWPGTEGEYVQPRPGA